MESLAVKAALRFEVMYSWSSWRQVGGSAVRKSEKRMNGKTLAMSTPLLTVVLGLVATEDPWWTSINHAVA
jgi:hypothetical protein